MICILSLMYLSSAFCLTCHAMASVLSLPVWGDEKYVTLHAFGTVFPCSQRPTYCSLFLIPFSNTLKHISVRLDWPDAKHLGISRLYGSVKYFYFSGLILIC